MRAYTSLAGHILGSHPAINGYFELHLGYENAAALERQLEVYRAYETLKPDSRYLFDKLLHNDYPLDVERLGTAAIKILVALLEPEQTIRSIVDLFARKGTDARYASPAAAAGYYIERLEWLAAFCASLTRPYTYYDAALFLADPEALLERLARWLELDTPLQAQYQIFSQTGRPGRGDSSPLIHSGRIERVRADYSHVHVPEAALGRARAVYAACRARIIAHAADALVLGENGSARR